MCSPLSSIAFLSLSARRDVYFAIYPPWVIRDGGLKKFARDGFMQGSNVDGFITTEAAGMMGEHGDEVAAM